MRVQVAQLRKKLERYAETEGLHDELILTIPRGVLPACVACSPGRKRDLPLIRSALDDVPPSPGSVVATHLLWAAVMVLGVDRVRRGRVRDSN